MTTKQPLPTYATILKWALIISIPIILGFGTVRAVINWNYPAWEYPRIAPDSYGWTPAQRLELAEATLAYLQRPESAEEVIFLLEELRDPTTAVPLYNEREIGHMIDVKNLTDAVQIGLWLAVVVGVGAGGVLGWKRETRTAVYQALYIGGLATVAILAFLVLLILVAWGFFFETFHELFFPPGTWTFHYTDALIRLFPEQFWFDAGLILTITPLILGLLVAFLGWFLHRRALQTTHSARRSKPKKVRS